MAASGKYSELLLLEINTHPREVEELSTRLYIVQMIAYSIQVWLADALLIYRLWVVWLRSLTVIIIPSVLYLGMIGVTCIALYHGSADTHPVVNLGVSFHSCSVVLNVLVTILITGKLLYHRRLVHGLLGEDHCKTYMSLVAVFAESGALYSIIGIVYIPLYATGSNMFIAFVPFLEAASVGI
ncbi:hypothetical protein BDQ17DRAFT_1231049 [Cyathus striatus]|nr:hypothetical protein BDQ17DRAFT_1231049 [Cyathus striatus]